MNQGTNMKTYQAGIDVGSTTVKLVILDEKGDLIFGEYRRHMAQTQQTLAQLLREAREKLVDDVFSCYDKKVMVPVTDSIGNHED